MISGSVIIWAKAQPELDTFPRLAKRNFIQLPFIDRTSFLLLAFPGFPEVSFQYTLITWA